MEKDIIKSEENMSERFTAAVLKEFSGSSGDIQVTGYQRNLVQGYFISIDRMLLDLEAGRIRKNAFNKDHSYDNKIPYTWASINMPSLARDVMCYSKLGLDMLADNHLFAIPYKNSKTNKYDLGFIKGYNGIKMLVEKYAMDIPKASTIEVVYSNDTFKPMKKSFNTPVETYQFEVTNPFDRGDIIGGFGYLEYEDPAKNKLYVMTMKEIEKRKPKNAAVEFWGGTKKDYSSKQDVEVEGWKDEMVYKSLVRHVFGRLPLDPAKIGEAYRITQQREADYKDMEVTDEIATQANKDPINVTPDEKPKEQELNPAQPIIKPPIDNTIKEEKVAEKVSITGPEF
jgi:recombination protein RecT